MNIPKIRFPWMIIFIALALSGLSCREEGYRLKKGEPAVQKALESRKARSPELRALKTKGVIGENNRGFIEVLKPVLTPKGKSLIEAENQDRKFIYETVVAQNHLGPDGLANVEEQYAKTRRERAKKGDRVQLPSGKWVKK